MVAVAGAAAGVGAGFPSMGQMMANAKASYGDDGLLGERTSSEKDQEYQQLPANKKKLGESLADAVRTDEKQVTTFWQEVGEFFDHGLNYWNDRRQFENRCEEIKREAEDALERVVALIDEKFEEHLDIPGDLTDEFHDWCEHARELKAIIDPIPEYGQVPNWNGPASQEYFTMTEVQVQACNELYPRAKNMAETLHVAENLNYSVLSAANSNVEIALGHMQKCAVTAGRFYVNTARCGTALSQLEIVLSQISKLANSPAHQLQARLQEVEASASVLRSGWPSGSSQHGQEGVPSPEIDVTAPKTPAGSDIDPTTDEESRGTDR